MSIGIQNVKREYFGKQIPEFKDLPNLIEIQLSSYKKLLESTTNSEGENQMSGLEEVLYFSYY